MRIGSVVKQVNGFLKKDSAYTFSLFVSFLFVTFGTVVLALMVWYGSAWLGYFALRGAASSAALAAQSQVQQVRTGTGMGFLAGANWALTSSYQNAASRLFQQEVENMHLNQVFDAITCETSANGNQVVVTAEGQYLPLFLQTLAARFPEITAVSIPMQVQVKTKYTVVGG